MIAACPKCKTKFRIDKERLAADGVRLRCTQCSTVFRVKAPEERTVVAEPTVDAELTPQPKSLDPERLVLVAHSDAEATKELVDAVETLGLCAISAGDGVEAILAIQRSLPRAVVLDAALPKMYGFQVCELVKRNDSLRSIGVVLVGAIYDETRYRRPPNELYGADVYLETPDLPDGLPDALARLGLPVRALRQASRPAAAPPPPPPARSAAPAPRPAPSAPPRAEPRRPAPPLSGPTTQRTVAPSGPPAGEDEVAKAERLARIIVSDVVLYNEKKFAAAVKAGNVAQALEPDLAEGRALFQARIAPAVAAQRDFLRDELLRVARQRGMR
jgi:predicted Zn finger-like uncharacterized protein